MDGSNLGILAERAMSAIVGGETFPEPSQSPDQVLLRIQKVPLPDSGMAVDSYNDATDVIAHAMFCTSVADDLNGDCHDAWKRAKEKWPNLDDYMGGASRFMVGFAWNTVRYIHGATEQSNPAIITIRVVGE